MWLSRSQTAKGDGVETKKSPKKLGENILSTPTGRRRNIMDSEARSGGTDQPKTPGSSNKRKKLRKTCSKTPSRGEGTILEFLSSRNAEEVAKCCCVNVHQCLK